MPVELFKVRWDVLLLLHTQHAHIGTCMHTKHTHTHTDVAHCHENAEGPQKLLPAGKKPP